MRKTLNEDDVLKEIDRWIGYLDEDMITRIKIGIKKLPSAQPKPCEDVVNREDVLEVNFLMPESELVFYDNDHGFCINTQDVLEHIERYVQWER